MDDAVVAPDGPEQPQNTVDTLGRAIVLFGQLMMIEYGKGNTTQYLTQRCRQPGKYGYRMDIVTTTNPGVVTIRLRSPVGILLAYFLDYLEREYDADCTAEREDSLRATFVLISAETVTELTNGAGA